MKVVTISRNEFEKLKKLKLHHSTLNTESDLYPYTIKEEWKDEYKLLKVFYDRETETFSHKQTLLNNIDLFYDDINIPELVLPEKKLVIEDEEVGYLMTFIKNNVNMSVIFTHKDLPLEIKIEYLKEIANILKKIRELPHVKNEFFLGDVHEGNFIYDFDTSSIKAVDIDSCKLKTSFPFESKYLVTNKNIYTDKLKYKYPTNYQNITIPTKNTDLLCLITMVLNVITDSQVQRLSIESYYLLLEYLKNHGFSIELIDAFSSIYEPIDNKDISLLLDEIPLDIEKVDVKNFVRKLKKGDK